MVIYGSARPAYGPADVLVENGRIAYIGSPSSQGTRPADVVIDATGKYVMPGIVNTHMHWHEERQPGMPQPIQYERNLYLAAGVTTAREVGGDFEKSKAWQAESNAHTIISPRILVYPVVSKGEPARPAEIRAWIRDIKRRGADGLKIIAMDRDQLEAILDEARTLGLRTTAHIGVEETTAKDYIELGVSSIEHFYGVADAALNGVQNFPPDMNYNDEIQRFARAGELWAQADPGEAQPGHRHDGRAPGRLEPDVLDLRSEPRRGPRAEPAVVPRVSAPVAWRRSSARRSTITARTSSAGRARRKRTGRSSTASGWTRVREFGVKGGLVTTGDDAGYIYSMYGFGIARELELHEEAGFHPLEVIEHATWNGARMLGLEDRLGKVREGFVADLLVVNGNPLENLKLLNPYGADVMTVNGRPVSNYTRVAPGDRVQVARGGGIEWTIKDGIPYHVPTLMREVRDMVAAARARQDDHAVRPRTRTS